MVKAQWHKHVGSGDYALQYCMTTTNPKSACITNYY